MNSAAQQVLKAYKMLKYKVDKFVPLYPKQSDAVKRGIEISRNVTRQEEYVHPTPIMKNALIIMGDTKQVQSNGEWHTEKVRCGVKTKAEKFILEVLHAAMLKELGPEIHEYPKDVPFVDKVYYHVDCYNAFDEIKEKFWDIAPGQLEEVKTLFKKFEDPKTNMSSQAMLDLIQRDSVMQKVIEIELKMWPSTMASRDIVKISDPFMSKKSGVSYPDYRNDAKPVDPQDPNSITWGQYEIELTRKAAEKGDSNLFQYALENNVYTGYTRRQRSKGRPLIAQSRRTNLVINMINGVEMENVKRTQYLRTPFVDEDTQLKELAQTAELALRNGLLPVNIDASKWDVNLGVGPLIEQDAERYVNAVGDFSKKLVELRTLCNTKAYFVNGPANKVVKIYGRQFSGYDDTTLANTKANRSTASYGALKTDPKYIAEVAAPMQFRHVLTVGDDLLIVLRNRDFIKKYIDCVTKTFGLVIHGDEKFAIGVMFIQWRVFKYYGKYVMAYNVPRVIRSMCSKEEAKHLGRGGWTFAFYQQLSKLRRYKPALRIAVNIMAAFDQHHLSLDVPIQNLIEMVKQEDQIAQSKGMNETTAERMYRSNPNIAGLVQASNGTVELDTKYFVKLQKEMREVYEIGRAHV